MLLVQKFGGTSVGSFGRIREVARRIARHRRSGDEVVAVVSAMTGDTDALVKMGEEMLLHGSLREKDVLLATGEQKSASLLALALCQEGVAAQSLLGFQVPILTDSSHGRAHIRRVGREKLLALLHDGITPVVAGFQGVDDEGSLTTLGRGGSDTTAAAVASALRADECQIFTDVDGVYTTDPRVVREARKLSSVTFEEMLEMASLGSKVLHWRSVAFAGRYRVKMRVLSSFVEESEGTVITYEEKGMEEPLVSAIAFQRNEAKITILGVPDRPGVAYQILGPVADKDINVDMVVQNVGVDGTTDFTFTVAQGDLRDALEGCRAQASHLGAREVIGDSHIAKVSVVGVGMRSHAGVAARMFEALAAEGINILMISTSEIKISVVIAEKYLELAVRALHEAFGLAAAEERG